MTHDHAELQGPLRLLSVARAGSRAVAREAPAMAIPSPATRAGTGAVEVLRSCRGSRSGTSTEAEDQQAQMGG